MLARKQAGYGEVLAAVRRQLEAVAEETGASSSDAPFKYRRTSSAPGWGSTIQPPSDQPQENVPMNAPSEALVAVPTVTRPPPAAPLLYKEKC